MLPTSFSFFSQIFQALIHVPVPRMSSSDNSKGEVEVTLLGVGEANIRPKFMTELSE